MPGLVDAANRVVSAGIAALVGGPAAGAAVLAQGTLAFCVPHAREWAQRRKAQGDVTRVVTAWAGQRVAHADLELGMGKAAKLLESCGASMDTIADLALDPDAVAIWVLKRGARLRNELTEESAREVCDETVRAFYRQLYQQLRKTEPTLPLVRKQLRELAEVKDNQADAAAVLSELRDLLAQRSVPTYRNRIASMVADSPALMGRDGELTAIKAAVHGEPGYVWVHGERWSGKTTLALTLAECAVGPEALGDDVDVVAYFLSRREDDADVVRFRSAVVPQLERLLDKVPGHGDPRDTFLVLWREACNRAETMGRQLLLLVDGLDEDTRPRGFAVEDALPAELGRRGHVLVTSTVELPPGAVRRNNLLMGALSIDLQPSAEAHETQAKAFNEISALLAAPGEAGRDAALLGVLAAARGPLTSLDLAEICRHDPYRATNMTGAAEVENILGRDLAMTVGRSTVDRDAYVFLHGDLLAACQRNEALEVPRWQVALDAWAADYAQAGWPVTASGAQRAAPLYLMRTYPNVVEPTVLAGICADPGWLNASVRLFGVKPTLTTLRAHRTHDALLDTVARMLATQIHELTHPPADDAGYVARQLCLQAVERGEADLAAALRGHLSRGVDPTLVPLASTYRVQVDEVFDLGQDASTIKALAALPDGRIVSGGLSHRVLLWDPRRPAEPAVELGQHENTVLTIVVLDDGRVVSGGLDGRVLMWDPNRPGAPAVELARHSNDVRSLALVRAPKTCIVSGGYDDTVRVSLPDGASTRVLGHANVSSMAMLDDRRILTAGTNYRGDGVGDDRVQLWEPGSPGGARELFHKVGGWHPTVTALPGGAFLLALGDGLLTVYRSVDATGSALPNASNRPVVVASSLGSTGVVVVDESGAVFFGDWDRPGPWVELARRGVTSIAVLDASTIAVAHGASIAVWRLTDTMAHQIPPTAVAALPGHRAVLGDADGGVGIWTADTGRSEPIARLPGRVERLVALNDGSVVAYAGTELWHCATDHEASGPTSLGTFSQFDVLVPSAHDQAVLTFNNFFGSGGELERRTREGGTSLHGPDKVADVAPLSDGRLAVYGPGDHSLASTHGQVAIWGRDRSQDVVTTIKPEEPGAYPPPFLVLTDGRLVTQTAQDGLAAWDLDDLVSPPLRLGPPVHGGIFAALPDGRLVVGEHGGNTRLSVLRTDGSSAVATIECSSPVRGLSVAPPARAGEQGTLVVLHGAGISIWGVG
jgi:hypothetical protein